MRIVLDLQGCQSASRLRGIGRYSLSLAKMIARKAEGHEIWLLLSDLFPDMVMPLRQEFAELVPAEHIAVFAAPGPVAERDPANSARARLAELVREHAIAELRPDVVHIGSLFEGFVDDAVTSVGCLAGGAPTAVTLYDLIPLLNPERYLDYDVYRDYYLRKIDSLKRADLLLPISASAGAEALAFLGLGQDRVIEIGSAVEERFVPLAVSPGEIDQTRERFGLTKPFVLYIGAIEPRKNFETLIRAFASLPHGLKAANQLLLVAQGTDAARSGLRQLASSLGLGPNDLLLVDHVPDDDLVHLYNLCRLFVFPSLHEGFGLPALEAMSCGAAVIGSSTTSIPEVIGREDALFDPISTDSIAQTMARALTDEAFSQSLREHGLRQAKRFSWERTAIRALEAFEVMHQRRAARAAVGLSPYRRLISAIADSGACSREEDRLQTAQAIASNLAPKQPRQLLVDISELAERDARTGIQRVTRAILNRLLVRAPEGFRVTPVRFDRARFVYRYAQPFGHVSAGLTQPPAADEWIEAHRGDVFLGLDFVPDILPMAVPTLGAMRRRGVKIVCVVYDLLVLRHPNWWPPNMHELVRAWMDAAASTSDMLVGISSAVVQDLQDWLDEHRPAAPRPVLAHFRLGADLDGSAPTRGLPGDAEQVLERLALAPTFLMVGTLEPRKGHDQVLSAFDELWQSGVDANLVIVGKQGWLVEDLVRRVHEHSALGRRLFWLQAISDEYLARVYAASTCLIAASQGEGFGLPLVEAGQHGLPVIARDLPVFREVAGEHAYYFSGASPQDLATALRNWLALRDLGQVPGSEGMHCPTWAESAAELMKVVVPKGDAVHAGVFDGGEGGSRH